MLSCDCNHRAPPHWSLPRMYQLDIGPSMNEKQAAPDICGHPTLQVDRDSTSLVRRWSGTAHVGGRFPDGHHWARRSKDAPQKAFLRRRKMLPIECDHGAPSLRGMHGRDVCDGDGLGDILHAIA
eukprot:7383172-Prymnesium_polylepis.1